MKPGISGKALAVLALVCGGAAAVIVSGQTPKAEPKADKGEIAMNLREGAMPAPEGAVYAGGVDGGQYLRVAALAASDRPLAAGEVFAVTALTAWADDGQGYLVYAGQALFVPPEGWPETTRAPDAAHIAATGWIWGNMVQFKMPGGDAIGSLLFLQPLAHEAASAP